MEQYVKLPGGFLLYLTHYMSMKGHEVAKEIDAAGTLASA